MFYLALFTSHRSLRVLVKLSPLTGVPQFNCIVPGEALWNWNSN